MVRVEHEIQCNVIKYIGPFWIEYALHCIVVSAQLMDGKAEHA